MMTGKQNETQASEGDPGKPVSGAGAVTRADLKAEEKPTDTPKSVKLKAPSGTAVETSEENAETLRGAGFS